MGAIKVKDKAKKDTNETIDFFYLINPFDFQKLALKDATNI